MNITPKPLSREDVDLMAAARAAAELVIALVGAESAVDALQVAGTLARRAYRKAAKR